MYNYDRNIEDVIYEVKKNHKVPYINYIHDVYKYAKEKHEGQERKSGEAYIKHPLRVAYYVASWGLESDAICAALLHDVVEDCKNVTITEIEERFGSGIADLVDCLTSFDTYISDAEKDKYTKDELDRMADEYLVKKINRKALLIKIADRLDNLNTIDCFPLDKQIKKAQHTRKILIPLAKRSKAYYLVDELENLCYKIEHRDRYNEISLRYNLILTQNNYSINIFKERCSKIFENIAGLNELSITNEQKNDVSMELLNFICEFEITKRTISSLNRQINHTSGNYTEKIERTISKEKTPLLDLSIVIDDSFLVKKPNVPVFDVFYAVYDKYLINEGVKIVSITETTFKDASYIVVKDMMNNLYRFFVNSKTEFTRYKIGDIVDNMSGFNIDDIDNIDPGKKKIKVYRRDGSEMYIDEGATVLDFAFAIHTEIGLHFKSAIIDGDPQPHDAGTVLIEGDRVNIYHSPEISPTIAWFRHAKTKKAIEKLIKALS